MDEKELVKIFKALGEPTRFRIVKLLSILPMCVCEIGEVLSILQPRVSQHLKILREAGLVKEKREGYWVIYHLDNEKFTALSNTFESYLKLDLEETPGFEEESLRLDKMAKEGSLRHARNRGAQENSQS